MNTDTPRTDEAAVDVWRKSNGERMATSSDKVDADFARCLERELNEARFDLDFSRRLADWQSKTIDDLTAQRDEARDEAIRTREFMDYGFAKAQEELSDMTAQRDRLADSLCSVFNLIHEDPQSAKDLAETTLQSLTPKS